MTEDLMPLFVKQRCPECGTTVLCLADEPPLLGCSYHIATRIIDDDESD